MKLSDKAKDVIAAIAPTLGTVLGGPLGGLAGAIIAEKFGVEKDDTKAVENAIVSSSPDALLKLREAENALVVKMRELDIDVEKINAADRASARELAKINMVPQIGLSIAFVFGYFILMYMFFFGKVAIPAEWKTEAAMLLGILTVNVPIIMQFWFGSSSGSAHKTNLLAQAPAVES